MDALTFAQLAQLKSGTVLDDGHKEGIRYIIVRGPCSLCAYLGIPASHPLANRPYDDVPVDCHGGLTFSAIGDGDHRPADLYWYGWDYGHSGDRSFYDLKEGWARGDAEWTVPMVRKEIWGAAYSLRKLMTLVEKTGG